MNGRGNRACRPMNAKVKGCRTGNRITKVREISINYSDIPSNARNKSPKGIDKGHVTFRVDVNKKNAKGAPIMKSANDGSLRSPKGQLSVVVEKPMGM